MTIITAPPSTQDDATFGAHGAHRASAPHVITELGARVREALMGIAHRSGYAVDRRRVRAHLARRRRRAAGPTVFDTASLAVGGFRPYRIA